MNSIELIKQIGNPDFQGQLLENPHQALKEIGADVATSTEIKVVRNSKDNIHLVIPTIGIKQSDIPDEELQQVVASGAVLAAIAIATIVTVAIVGAVSGVISGSVLLSDVVD